MHFLVSTSNEDPKELAITIQDPNPIVESKANQMTYFTFSLPSGRRYKKVFVFRPNETYTNTSDSIDSRNFVNISSNHYLQHRAADSQFAADGNPDILE